MKRILLISFACITAMQCCCQQTVTCKLILQPKTIYAITKNMTMNLEMDTGSSAGNGKKMTMGMTSETIYDVTTGVSDNAHTFPVKMVSTAKDVKILVNGQDLPGNKGVVPPALSFYGKYKTGEKFSLDSVGGMSLPDSTINGMATMVDAAMNNFAFPDGPLKTGDSFTRDVPLLLPGVPLAPGATIRMTFTLKRVSGSIASFDFTGTINGDPKQDPTAVGTPVNMTGSGHGTLDIDMKKAFFSAMTNQLSIHYDMLSGHSRIKCSGTFSSTDKASAAL